MNKNYAFKSVTLKPAITGLVHLPCGSSKGLQKFLWDSKPQPPDRIVFGFRRHSVVSTVIPMRGVVVRERVENGVPTLFHTNLTERCIFLLRAFPRLFFSTTSLIVIHVLLRKAF